LDVGAGVVDRDYRGPVGVVMFNFGNEDFTGTAFVIDYVVKKGDRIAQLIVEKIEMLPIEQVDDLDLTQRGKGGFGSTGI
jgi:deoxyuridine 5'-triphosphate nucleotidohydrolase